MNLKLLDTFFDPTTQMLVKPRSFSFLRMSCKHGAEFLPWARHSRDRVTLVAGVLCIMEVIGDEAYNVGFRRVSSGCQVDALTTEILCMVTAKF